MRVLITGVAGFIGFHAAINRLEKNQIVIGLDNLNEYYDVNLKKSRLNILAQYPNFLFLHCDIAKRDELKSIFAKYSFDVVIHLAAQAGVRYSIEKPEAYVDSNVVGFSNIIEAARYQDIGHFVYASSSSVYGANQKLPYKETDTTDHPISLYAATKKANELIAHSYSHLFNMPVTGLRFFTVYGPWGRPDMALFLFTRSILAGETIKVFNNGNMKRDFTYIDDIIEGLSRVIDSPAKPDSCWDPKRPRSDRSSAAYRIYNIGHSQPVGLMDYIQAIELATGKKALIEKCDIQKGEVLETHADVSALAREFDYHPQTSISTGIEKFIEWYQSYYR